MNNKSFKSFHLFSKILNENLIDSTSLLKLNIFTKNLNINNHFTCSLKQYIFYKVIHEKEQEWLCLGYLGSRFIYCLEEKYNILSYNTILLFEKLIDICEEYYDFNIFEYYLKNQKKIINISDKILFYDVLDLTKDISKLEKIFRKLIKYF